MLALTPNPDGDRGIVTANDQIYIDVVNVYTTAGINQTQARIEELRNTWDFETLAGFASPRYRVIHDHWTQVGLALGSPMLVNLMAETRYAAQSYLRSYIAVAVDQAIAEGLVVLGFVGAVWPGGTWLSLVVSAVQLYRSGDRYYAVYPDAQDALATAPGASFGAAVTTQEASEEARLDLALETIFFGLDGVTSAHAVRSARKNRLLKRDQEMLRKAEAQLDAAIPAGEAASVRSIDLEQANEMLRQRLGRGDAVDGFERRNDYAMGDTSSANAQFFIDRGLQPQRTMTSGALTIHVSRPFKGPDGRTSVIAFQETGDGNLVPRTFYISGEHGIWRAATSYVFLTSIDKGAVQYRGGPRASLQGPDGKTLEGNEMPLLDTRTALAHGNDPSWKVSRQHVNKASADIAAELQGPLSRMTEEFGVRDLDFADTNKAFYSWLESPKVGSGREYDLWVPAADAATPLRTGPGTAPDIAAGPLDSWTLESPVYGTLEGRLYGSQDGSTLFVVLADADGNVFVPSIQDAGAGLTPFGTRWEALDPRLMDANGNFLKDDLGNVRNMSATPRTKEEYLNGVIEVPGSPYFRNPNFENPLSRTFATAEMPPIPGAPPVRAAATPDGPRVADWEAVAARMRTRSALGGARAGREALGRGGPEDPSGAGPFSTSRFTLGTLVASAQQRAAAMFGPEAANWPAYPAADGDVMVRSPDGQHVIIATVENNSQGQPWIVMETYSKEGRLWEHGRRIRGVWIETSSTDDPPPAAAGPALEIPATSLSLPAIPSASGQSDVPTNPELGGSDAPSEGPAESPPATQPDPPSIVMIDPSSTYTRIVPSITAILEPGPEESADLANALGSPSDDPVVSLPPNVYIVGDSIPAAIGPTDLPVDDTFQSFMTGPVGATVGGFFVPMPAPFSDFATHAAISSPRLLSPSSSTLPAGTIVRLAAAVQQEGANAPALSIVATGASSGEAFFLEVLTPDGRQMQVMAPAGLVLQAVRAGSTRRVSEAVPAVDTVAMIGFCLEYPKPPPPAGMLYQVAPAAVQELYRPLRQVLEAGRRLAEQGLLNPDSDPEAYATFIQQWALWTQLEGWDLESFTREMVTHARKNIEDGGVEWVAEIEAALTGAAPNRFQDIQTVLQASSLLR